MRRALIAGNTDLPPRRLWAPWLRSAQRIIAADGGADRLLKLGIVPDDIVGDLDSVTPRARGRVRGRVVEDLDPDRTDLEKALRFAQGQGYGDLTLIGFTQGRLDHVLGAVAILDEWSRKLRVRMVDSDFVTERVDGRLRFRARLGTLVSLYATHVAKGVTTRGLRWALTGATLKRGALGIHNQVVSNLVEVKVDSGSLFVLRGHRVDPHR